MVQVEAFSRYDKDGTGRLDALEFEVLARDMGFGSAANEIFSTLDADQSGSITYTEVTFDNG